MSGQIVLLDLPSRSPCKCWSLNPWKIRLLLNYKGVDYKTEWTEYPDIGPRCKDHIKLREGKPKHTIPTVILPDGTWIDESLDIAKKINELCPEPKLALETPALTSLTPSLLPGLMASLKPIYMSLVPARLLNESSQPYWMETRTEIIGKSPDTVTDADRDAAWKEVEKSGALVQVTGLLKAQGGPFFEGKEVSYVDFVWAGFLIFCKRLDILDRALSLTGDETVHRKLLEAVGPWSKRDDY